jgi:hypothetical protein
MVNAFRVHSAIVNRFMVRILGLRAALHGVILTMKKLALHGQ